MGAMAFRWLLTCALVVPLLALPARAEDDDEDWAFRRELNERYTLAFRQEVHETIDSGLAWLRASQLADGSWRSQYGGRYPLGPTALATLTLLKGGVVADSPTVQKAFAYMRKQKLQRTYSVSVLLMALDAKYDPAKDPFDIERDSRYATTKKRLPCEENISKADKAWMRAGVKFLVDAQSGDGVWRYPSGGFDLSNTQYALLGLKAALRCGIKVPTRVWLDALRFLLDHQEKFGPPVIYEANEIRGRYRLSWKEKALARGFRYVNTSQPITGSMTTAGLAGLIICQGALWKSRKFTGRLRERTRTGIRDAMAWMQTFFDVTHNPIQSGSGKVVARPGGYWHYYYLYGLERAGILGRIRYFGDNDWYRDGAEIIFRDQVRQKGSDAGYWPFATTGVGQRPSLENTCFAILFLKRATPRMRTPAITPNHK